MQHLKKLFLGRDSGGPRGPLPELGDRPLSAPPPLPAPDGAPDEQTPSASWRDPSAFATEAERLALLQSMQVLRSPPESRFDCITRLMASIFQVPVALVSLSGSDTLYFKSVAGEFGSCLQRAGSFCDIIMVPDEPEVCLLEDLSFDARFSAHPNVAGAPHLRFYAGAPLVGSTGHRYGTLCILDVKPRSFPASQLNTLVNFAELVTRELEMGSVVSSTGTSSTRSSGGSAGSQEAAEKMRPPVAFEDPVALLDLAAGDAWPLMYANSAWGREAAVPTYPICLVPSPGGAGNGGRGSGESSMCSSTSSREGSMRAPRLAFWDLFEAEDASSRAAVDAAVAANRPVKFAARRKGPLGELVPPMLVVLRPAGDAITTRVPVGIPGFAPFGDAAAPPSTAAPPSKLWFASLRSAEAPKSYTMPQKPVRTRRASADTSRRASRDSQVAKGAGDFPVTPKGVVLSAGRRRQNSEDSAASTISVAGSTAAATLALPSFFSASGTAAGVSCARPHRHLPQVTPSEMLPYGMILPERYSDMLLGPLLGVGALGRVHRAVWRDRLVAVKLIEMPLYSPGWAQVERAVKEGAISIDLHHPNVVQTLDFAHSRRAVQAPPPAAAAAFGGDWLAEPTDEMNCVWLVSELADRGKLADALDRGWLRQERAPDAAPHLPSLLRTGADVAAALAFLHSRGIIHGDLTYNNVLLARDARDPRGWTAKVADFGLPGLVVEAAQRLGHYGWAAHAAPEALLHGAVSPVGDMYSLGVLLWEMWTGTRAWCGAQTEQIIAAAEAGDGLTGLPEEAPAALRALTARCLAVDPAGRPTAAEACVELQAMLLQASAPLDPEKGVAAE